MRYHELTIRISDDRLARARSEFPSTTPAKDPSEWNPTDFDRALAALYHRDFEVVGYKTTEGDTHA